MRIQYFSDLHLERLVTIPRIVQTADYLILAGDIGYPETDIYREFMYQCGQKYRHTFLVHGNHEWDRGSPLPYRPLLPHNVHLLDNESFTIAEARLTIIGCTLWTSVIRPRENLQSIRFLWTQLNLLTPQNRAICITHHLPSFQLIARQYQHLNSSTHHRFANHLETLMHLPIAPLYWICGHSHSFVERRIGRTQCLINTYPQRYRTNFTLSSPEVQ